VVLIPKTPEFPDGQRGHCMDTTMRVSPAGCSRLPRYSVGGQYQGPGRIPYMDAIANGSAPPQRPSTSASSSEIASRLSAAAIDADEGIVKQMLANLLRGQVRRSD